MLPTSEPPNLCEFNKMTVIQSALSMVMTYTYGICCTDLLSVVWTGTIGEDIDEDDTITFHNFSVGDR
jgi:hypothetical protein